MVVALDNASGLTRTWHFDLVDTLLAGEFKTSGGRRTSPGCFRNSHECRYTVYRELRFLKCLVAHLLRPGRTFRPEVM